VRSDLTRGIRAHYRVAVLPRFLVFFVLIAGSVTAQSPTPALPAGKGRAETQRICSACHGLEVVTKNRADKDQWSAIVDDMVGRGASGTSDEFEIVIRYLAANFGVPAKTAPAEPAKP
jgi:mono/diheme cytochrome c family protein